MILLNSSRLCYEKQDDDCEEELWCAEGHTQGEQRLIDEVQRLQMAVLLGQKGDKWLFMKQECQKPYSQNKTDP